MTSVASTFYALNKIHQDSATASCFFLSDNGNGLASLSIIVGITVHKVEGMKFRTNGEVAIFNQDIIKEIFLEFFEADKHSPVAPTTEDPRAGKQMKKNPIQVVRFIRPYHKHSNLYGVTLVFTLDYEKKTIDVGISVCNGDNFDNAVGVNIAENGDNYILGLTMPDYIYNCTSRIGLVEWFFEHAEEENADNGCVQYNVSPNAVSLMCNMYDSSK